MFQYFPEEDRRAYVPRLYRVDRVIQDERRRARPAEPETVQSPLAMDWLALKCPALQVLLDHPGVDGSRVTAFSTLFHLSQLAAMQTWFVDGTFKTRPAIYRNKASQVYTIHGFVGGPNGMKQFPMVFVLMTNRRTEDYVHLFEGVKRAMQAAGLPCNPESFMLDFEAAVFAAIRVCFPAAKSTGCGFHWAKCIRAKWRDLALHRSARETAALRSVYVRSQCLRFLAENWILVTFDKIVQEAARDFHAAHAVHRFLHYMNTTWIRTEVFPPSIWCQYGLDLRTNNDVEAWHAGFNRTVGPRPALYTFIAKMYVQLGNSRLQIENGDLNRRESLVTQENNAWFYTLWQQLERGEIEMEQLVAGIAARYNYELGAVI